MSFRVRQDSPVPIYEQIVDQLTYAIAAGDLPAGATVPSVRELATQLIVNPNTVGRAFQELERLGVLESRRGVGMAVTADGPKQCRDRRKATVRGRLRDALREASAAGFTLDDVHKTIDADWPAVAAGRNGHTSR